MEGGWLRYIWYEFIFWVSALVMTLLYSIRTEGHRNIPRHGPVLLLANHQSYLDTVPVGVAVRRHPVYLARSNLFENWFLRMLIYSLNGVPVNQEGFAREGLRTVLEQLRAGRAVIIFPEGERTSNGKMLPFKPGIYLLIKRMKIPIVPVGLAGAFEAWPRWRTLPALAPLFLPAARGTLAVSVGKPIDSRRYADMPREKVLSDLFEEVAKARERAEQLRRK